LANPRRKGKSGCLTTGEVSAIEAKADAVVLDAVVTIAGERCGDNVVNQPTEECDGPDDDVCPGLCFSSCTCPTPIRGNGSVEMGEACDSPCQQGTCDPGQVCNGFCDCEPVAPCDCGSAVRTQYTYTASPPPMPNCGTTDGGENPTLDCAGLYIGGGGGLPVPAPSPDEGVNICNVDCCNGTSLALSNTTAGEVGIRNCTSAGCLFGAPLPVLDDAVPPISSCVVNTVVAVDDGRHPEELIADPADRCRRRGRLAFE
jgi:hypothetical protein